MTLSMLCSLNDTNYLAALDFPFGDTELDGGW